MNLIQKQLIASFLIGSLIGVAAGSRLQNMAAHNYWKHAPDTHRLFDKFNRELKLGKDQQEPVQSIIEKRHAEMIALQREMAARFHGIRMLMRSDISRILTPDQQKHFEEMARRWDAKHPYLIPEQPATEGPSETRALQNSPIPPSTPEREGRDVR